MALVLALACLATGYFLGYNSGVSHAEATAEFKIGGSSNSGSGRSTGSNTATAGASGGGRGADERQQQQQEVQAQPDQRPAAQAVAVLGGGTSSSAGSSSTSAAGVKTVCEDSCAGHASNGVCDDGRPEVKLKAGTTDTNTIYEVHCDLGTDCSDCGAWVHNNTDASDSWRPIQEIRAKQFAVFSRQVAHPTGFFMAFTDPKQDVDVSSNIFHGGLLEAPITFTWHLILREGCRGPTGEQRLVADVGGNVRREERGRGPGILPGPLLGSAGGGGALVQRQPAYFSSCTSHPRYSCCHISQDPNSSSIPRSL